MEWTFDNDPFDLNPILCSSDTHKIKSLCSEYDISIPSITCDCFMDYPLWGSDLYDFNKGRFNLVLDACKGHSISLLVIPLVDNPYCEFSQVVELKKLLRIIRFDQAIEPSDCFRDRFKPTRYSIFFGRSGSLLFWY